MKKFLLFGAAALLVAAASCSKKGAEGDFTNPQGLSNFNDSLTYYTGTVQGLNLGANIERMLPEDIYAKFNKEEFLAGIKHVLESDTTNQSYLLGLSYGTQVLQQIMSQKSLGVDINVDEFYNAFAAAFQADSVADSIQTAIGATAQLLNGRAQTIMMQRQQEMQAAQLKALEEKAIANDNRGRQYVDSVKAADPEVKTTESGLSYKVKTMGTGAVAAKEGNDTVMVKYTGRHIDGTEFDSSEGEETPMFVNRVVRGFSEALTTFPVGSVVTLYIPADIAYGSQGQGAIEPGETLVFDLEICGIKPAPAKK